MKHNELDIAKMTNDQSMSAMRRTQSTANKANKSLHTANLKVADLRTKQEAEK